MSYVLSIFCMCRKCSAMWHYWYVTPLPMCLMLKARVSCVCVTHLPWFSTYCKIGKKRFCTFKGLREIQVAPTKWDSGILGGFLSKFLTITFVNFIEKFTAWWVNSTLNFTRKTNIARIAKRYWFFKWNLMWNSLVRQWVSLESHS